jgi:hypothetical protein
MDVVLADRDERHTAVQVIRFPHNKVRNVRKIQAAELTIRDSYLKNNFICVA